MPGINARFILITHQGDTNIDSSYAAIADHPKIVHWFAQNCLLEHPKVTPLPIGLEDRWRHNNGAYGDFKRLARRTGPTIPRIAYAFSLGTNVERRTECYKALKRCPAAEELRQPLNARLYRDLVRRFMLVASPPGNGADCHRTWEAIYMRCVPVVEDNSMNRRFKAAGAPLVLVREWGELEGWDEARSRSAYESARRECDARICFSEYWEQVFRGGPAA